MEQKDLDKGRCSSTAPGIPDNPAVVRLLAEVSRAESEIMALELQRGALHEALAEALLQIEYLRAKFAATGTGEAVLARGRIALAKAVPPTERMALGGQSNTESSPVNLTEES